MEYLKTKSAAKVVIPRGAALDDRILAATGRAAAIVGGTLGPGGLPVLIERPEYGLPPFVTKDGVTVFRALAFQDAVEHCVMEVMRDTSSRTADEAGDGTTTACILTDALTRRLKAFCKAHVQHSAQAVAREIQTTVEGVLLPAIKKLAVRARIDTATGQRLLRNVAQTSGNGDAALAAAVMAAFAVTGDDGNVTIVEASGPFAYPVEAVQGYPCAVGYEESCQRYAPEFINRQETQQVLLDKPIFLLYYGRVNDMATLLPILEKIYQGVNPEGAVKPYLRTPNLVVAATGFSDQVLAQMALNFKHPQALNILPLKVPHSPMTNGQRQFLDDLAAWTAAEVYDPVSNPVEDANFLGLGNLIQTEDPDGSVRWEPLGVTGVEVGRYRTTIHGYAHEQPLKDRVGEVRGQLAQAESQLDRALTAERLAKLTGGIARITVQGSNNAEIKERRDRVEDAVCAVRGALKHGVLPGGCWTLARLGALLPPGLVNSEILVPALLEPARCLYRNAGVSEANLDSKLLLLDAHARVGPPRKAVIYDAAAGAWVVAFRAGILDSTPAVSEALKNAVACATNLGTTGGMVVQPRDHTAEVKEARDRNDYDRMVEAGNPADERS